MDEYIDKQIGQVLDSGAESFVFKLEARGICDCAGESTHWVNLTRDQVEAIRKALGGGAS